MNVGHGKKLVSKPFPSDPSKNISPARNIRNEIKILQNSIPSSTDIEFLIATNPEEATHLLQTVDGIQRKIGDLEATFAQLVERRRDHFDEVSQRHEHHNKQERRKAVTDWMRRERESMQRVDEARKQLREWQIARSQEIEQRVSAAVTKADEKLESRVSATLSKIEQWEAMTSEVERAKSMERRERNDKRVAEENERRRTAELSSIEAERSQMLESLSQSFALEKKVHRISTRREVLSQQRARNRQMLNSLLPTHVDEARSRRQEKYEALWRASEEKVARSRQRRNNSLAAHVEQHRAMTTSRELSSEARSLQHKNEMHAKRLNKVQSIEEKFGELRKKESSLQKSIQDARISRSVDLSYRSSSFVAESAEVKHRNLQVEIADRWVTRIIKVGEKFGIRPSSAAVCPGVLDTCQAVVVTAPPMLEQKLSNCDDTQPPVEHSKAEI